MTSDRSNPQRLDSMPAEALERLIYVVGSARGGTSLTKDVIGLHDNVVSFLGPTHFLNHPWRHRRRLDPRLWNIVFWLPSTVRHVEVRESLDPERRDVFQRHVNRALARRDFRELYQLYPLVRALDPDEQRNPKDLVAWLDKGNDFGGVDLLPQHFPQARFVFVVRDPRGAVASLAKRMADTRPDTELKVEPRDVVRSAIYWRNLMQQELRFARRYPDRTIFFRFEDLVTQPLAIVPKLYRFLGLPALPDAELRNKIDALVYSASLESEQGAGISAKPVERWRSKLSGDAVDCIAEICGPTARRFGYDLKEPAHRQGMWRLSRQIAGRPAQAVTLAKLVYMALRELQLGGAPGAVATPIRLVEAS
jgi:hypothetical protein